MSAQLTELISLIIEVIAQRSMGERWCEEGNNRLSVSVKL